MKSAPCSKCGSPTGEYGLCDNRECDDGPPITFRSIVGQQVRGETMMVGAKTRLTTTQVQYDMSTVRQHTLRQRHFTPLVVARADRASYLVGSLGLSALLSLLAVGLVSRAEPSEPGLVYSTVVLLVAPIAFFAMKASLGRDTDTKAKTPPELLVLMSREASADRGSMHDKYFIEVFENDNEFHKFVDRLERERRTQQLFSGRFD